jgi:hypothetical protein
MNNKNVGGCGFGYRVTMGDDRFEVLHGGKRRKRKKVHARIKTVDRLEAKAGKTPRPSTRRSRRPEVDRAELRFSAGLVD